MKNRTSVLTFILLSMCVCAVRSADAAEFWSDLTTIYTIYPHQDGLTFTVSSYTNPMSTCAGGARWLISKNAVNYETLVASLMLAYSQDLKIQFHVYDQTPTCEPSVDRFMVYK